MKKGRSNKTPSRRFALPKSKILRGRKNFDQLFHKNATVFKSDSIRIRFRIYNSGQTDCKMAFIVPARLGKAVHRNHMKRLLKEAYRLNQYLIADEVTSAGFVFHGALIANKTGTEYEAVKSHVTDLLKKTKNYINKTVAR